MPPVSRQHSDKRRPPAGPLSTLSELLAGLASVLVLGVLLTLWLQASRWVPSLATLVYLAMAGLIQHAWPDRRGLGWANRLTLLRGVVVALLAGALVDPALLARHPWPLAGLALLALLLDGADGWVARRTGSASAFGARFDMELDAFFILVLCLALLSLGKVGPWVLGIGLMRYGFVLAGHRHAWLRAPLPESRRRKAVCVWQVVALMLGLLPPLGAQVAGWLAATALVGLAGSFAVDVRWLWRNRK
ncbi:CDP-alcohol phosphatidyltransferase family protein [Halomonas campisalis]|uniref:CDP-alcohol phosphatidyltransferase family protein n=1 Tax=Billgrantia campisalis TaxID=74661 RepID=A0ABS9P700_9GAMM|nr:CDP-alcohol phosphatidyltransferase family protein [Halomonas campisalis]MCG6657533.1 CDP-alcohol phosphatidyltransferase family protein [Halomonas campisalis]MDR5863120.1 CDP-alcohol phosphatidyltransferase family protein [Halomonas campisalis]